MSSSLWQSTNIQTRNYFNRSRRQNRSWDSLPQTGSRAEGLRWVFSWAQIWENQTDLTPLWDPETPQTEQDLRNQRLKTSRTLKSEAFRKDFDLQLSKWKKARTEAEKSRLEAVRIWEVKRCSERSFQLKARGWLTKGRKRCTKLTETSQRSLRCWIKKMLWGIRQRTVCWRPLRLCRFSKWDLKGRWQSSAGTRTSCCNRRSFSLCFIKKRKGKSWVHRAPSSPLLDGWVFTANIQHSFPQ